ncbi:hypothetical protein [Streptomyces sp. NPDC001787]|uniref:hypothetical protein n=1 Tax=Streptomyces sp. NPDC001787 TaxID=3154523 RepID=UPI0033243403
MPSIGLTGLITSPDRQDRASYSMMLTRWAADRAARTGRQWVCAVVPDGPVADHLTILGWRLVRTIDSSSGAACLLRYPAALTGSTDHARPRQPTQRSATEAPPVRS